MRTARGGVDALDPLAPPAARTRRVAAAFGAWPARQRERAGLVSLALPMASIKTSAELERSEKLAKGMVSARTQARTSPTARESGAVMLALACCRRKGGGVAPPRSARAPDRHKVKDANAEARRGKKSAKWMEMVLEYAVYLGMDREEDEELLDRSRRCARRCRTGGRT